MNEYEIEYWQYTDDGYDNRYILVNARDEHQAILKAKSKTIHSKGHKVYERQD